MKLGLMKQYLKALDKEENCFRYSYSAFPGLSEEKLKAGIFDGRQIRKKTRDKDFTTSMTKLKKERGWPLLTWQTISLVIEKRKCCPPLNCMAVT